MSLPAQWIFLAGAFMATAALGWLVGNSQAVQLDAQLREPAGITPPTGEARWWRFGWILLAVLTVLGFAVVATKLGTYAQFLLLVGWGAGAGFLVGFGMCLWLRVRRKEKSGPRLQWIS